MQVASQDYLLPNNFVKNYFIILDYTIILVDNLNDSIQSIIDLYKLFTLNLFHKYFLQI